MVIACIILGCALETDVITQWVRHYINQKFPSRKIWHVASRALLGIETSQWEQLTFIIANNIFSDGHLKEENHFQFMGCHFHISERVLLLGRFNENGH